VKTFIGIMTLAAVAACGYAGFRSHAPHGYFALAILILASITSRMKVKLPGINGNMSMNLPFLLIGVANLSAAEVIVVTSVSTLVQCWPRKDAHFDTQRMAFNLSMMAFASSLASPIFHAEWLRGMQGPNNTPGVGRGNTVLRANDSSGWHRSCERRKASRLSLVKLDPTFVPILRTQCGCHINA
jgi:hypothetical protein